MLQWLAAAAVYLGNFAVKPAAPHITSQPGVTTTESDPGALFGNIRFFTVVE